VYELYSLRDWIEHYYKTVKHELGWADIQIRKERAIVRHWHLVMLAFTLSLIEGIAPGEGEQETNRDDAQGSGGKSAPRIVWNDTLRRVRSWLCPWARITLYWGRWSTAPPPVELSALLNHVAHSRPHLTNQRLTKGLLISDFSSQSVSRWSTPDC
jgi:hypothetical protein